MKSHKIHFKNREGVALSGRIDMPDQFSPNAWAIFAHCFTCGKSLKAIGHICRALTRERIAVLRFDFTGIGESEGDLSTAHFSSNVDDLLAAVDWLERNYQAPEILIGHSLGGTAVLKAAEMLPEIRAIATIAAPFQPDHLKHLLEDALPEIKRQGQAQVQIAGRTFSISEKFIKDLEEQSSAQSIENLDAALLVLHSPVDTVVDIDNARFIYRAAKHPKSFISLEDADHLLSRETDALYVGNMIAHWTARYLEDTHATPEAPLRDDRITVRTDRGGFFTEIYARERTLVADEPVEYGGTGKGPTPYDYLMTAIGSCTSMTIQMYAGRKKWPLESVVVRLQHQKVHAQDCRDCQTREGKIDHFEREIELIGDLSDDQRQKLLDIAERCPVHRTLHAEVRISSYLKSA